MSVSLGTAVDSIGVPFPGRESERPKGLTAGTHAAPTCRPGLAPAPNQEGRKSLSISRTWPMRLSVDSPCLLTSSVSHFPGTEFGIPLSPRPLACLPLHGLTWEVVCVTAWFSAAPSHLPPTKGPPRNSGFELHLFARCCSYQNWPLWSQVLVASPLVSSKEGSSFVLTSVLPSYSALRLIPSWSLGSAPDASYLRL